MFVGQHIINHAVFKRMLLTLRTRRHAVIKLCKLELFEAEILDSDVDPAGVGGQALGLLRHVL